MQIRLILDPALPPHGDAMLYALGMADALRALEHRVDVVDDPAPATDGVTLVDGSALARCAGAWLDQAVALIHPGVKVPDDATRVLRHIVAGTDQVAEALVARGGRADAVSVVAAGCDDRPRSTGSGGSACQILSVGPLIPAQGHDILLRSLAKLFDLDWRLVLAGPTDDAVYCHGLAGLADTLGIDRQVSFADAPTDALWASADLFALTPHEPGFSLVFAEALRRGLPVAATNVGAVPTLIGPECGIITAPGDMEQMSKALRRLIFDRELRRDSAQAAWQAGQALPSWRDQALRLVSILG